jgi:hypothetical protein
MTLTNFKCTGELHKRLDGRHGVSILDPRDVAAKQSHSLLDIALRKPFFLTQHPQTLSDNHGLILDWM